ncbi:dihydroxyacetone kinase [Marmoricola endophyticus]|uniref:Dihydroxyacetone kinase n=1 Tax=Marmoricola endophyticus TaxID=2040280 RepID=A0A917F2R9_9ACTN|nr:DAK2 domain-containing protein [Marmoricola endophyticus]GGF39177.1 dihydroxyacetone kinase [Marmoricola endophyticus]
MGEEQQEMPVDPAVATLARFADLAVDALGEAREQVDALNVFPVADADTGTNMFLTLEAARDALDERLAADRSCARHDAFATYSRAALLGARGNSGVILSQLLGGALRALGAAGADDRPADVLAEALRTAADKAYAAVGTPVEGTVLTVARAAASVAADRASGATLASVLRAAVTAAEEALERTTGQLPALREAGVVDAGALGLCLVLAAAERAVTGRRSTRPTVRRPAPPCPEGAGDTREGPAYEVMYLLEATPRAVEELRSSLAALGDSLVVVGDDDQVGDGLWHVHVHVDDAGAAVEAGIAAGTPRRIRITHLGRGTAVQAVRASRQGRRVLAVSAGPGLAEVFAEAGAVVVEGGPGRRPGTAELLDAVAGCGGAEVVLLPNDPQTQVLAEAAAREAVDLGVKAVVVPTSAQVQGIAALAVHDPSRRLEADVVAMTSAARHTRHGAVTVASRRAMTSVGPCEPGDVLGAIEHDFVVVGHDVEGVTRDLLGRLLDNGGELVTLVPGVDGPGGLTARVEAWVSHAHPGVDVCVHEGGQERYPLLLGVE